MDVSDARIAQIQRIKDLLGEKVLTLFKAFLSEFTEQNRLKYLDDALELIKPERSTLWIDFRDLINFDQELAKDISLEMYRFYPYLSRALSSFITEKITDNRTSEELDQLSMNIIMNKDFYIGFYGFEQVTKLREVSCLLTLTH